MGNVTSGDNQQFDVWWPPPHTQTEMLPNQASAEQTEETEITQTSIVPSQEISAAENLEASRRLQRELKLKEFRSEFEKKHVARREAIAERSREILFLREELIKYKKENEELKDIVKQNHVEDTTIEDFEDIKFELKKLRTENTELQENISELKDELNKTQEISRQNLDLRKSIAEAQKDLQSVNSQILEFEKDKHDYEAHVIALKDVIKVSKSLLEIRENQLRELKTKVAEIETSLAEREVSMLSTNLKVEYERQLENIRSLRAVYEHRQAATKAEKDLMASQLTEAKNNLETEQKKISEMQERIDELEENVSGKYDEIKNLESQLGLAKAEYRGLEAEMSVINQLFSQILFDFNNCPEIDFDKLIKNLEENHDLLTNIVINEESEAISSVLPKVLLDLVNQVKEGKKKSEDSKFASSTENLEVEDDEATSSRSRLISIPEEIVQPEQQTSNQMNSAEDIVNKLPKVWRVLIELLRQQCGQQPVDIQEEGTGTDPCYKSIQTPKGPKLVLSVSQTYIRLKDLILEKKSLEKETSRLKQLNTHLEVRLQDQEKRLETVSTELSKTWHVVGRMQKQHQQLHTHEKVLRYELGQKRKMLTELKQELEYCREKWAQARVKNSSTEEEWKKLRIEFAARKTAITVDDFNNSGESGYSDEPDGSSDEETDKRNKTVAAVSDVKEKEDTPSDVDVSNSSSKTISITNQGNDNTNIEKASECSTSINENSRPLLKLKTDVQVQIRTTQPASLDMIDDVCALGISPVVIDLEEHSAEIDPFTDIPANSHSEETIITHNETKQCTENDTPTESTNIVIVKPLHNKTNVEKTEISPPSIYMPEDPSTSTSTELTTTERLSIQAEKLRKREERLTRLEEQCRQLVTKVTNTNSRSTQMCNRLETLHEQYGNDPSTKTNAQAIEEGEQPKVEEDSTVEEQQKVEEQPKVQEEPKIEEQSKVEEQPKVQEEPKTEQSKVEEQPKVQEEPKIKEQSKVEEQPTVEESENGDENNSNS